MTARDRERRPAATAMGGVRGSTASPAPRRQRRRLVAVLGLAVLVVVIVVGIRAVAGPSGEEPAVAGRTSPPSPTASVGAVEACAAANLQLAVELPAGEFAVGSTVPMTVTMTHRGRPCLVDGSDASRQVVISSGTDQVWSSADCPSAARELLLSSGDQDAAEVTWSMKRSAAGCVAGGALGPGTYSVVVTVPGAGGVASEPVTFRIVPAR